MSDNLNGFERANPIGVPSDWYAQAGQLEMRLEQEESSLETRLGFEKAELQRRSVSIVYSKVDICQYFETIVNTPELWDIVQKQMPAYFDPDLEDDHNLLRMRIKFFNWWVLSRFSTSSWGRVQMSMTYHLSTVDAFAEYYTSGDVKKAYLKLERSLIEYGFRENSND